MNKRLLTLALCLLYSRLAAARTLEFNGRLTDAQGRPEEGVCLLRFQVFELAAGSPAVWSDSLYVEVKRGNYSVVLGQSRPLPAQIFSSGYRVSVSAPPGSGWIAKGAALPSPIGAPASAPSSRPSAAPAPPASAGDAGKLHEVRALKRKLEAPPPAAPPSAPLDALQREIEKTRADAEQSRREAELLKSRLDAVERELKDQNGRDARYSNIYEVKPGDTLRSIAIKVYGTPNHWVDLYQANADRIQRGGDLTPGQRLVVPEVDK